MNTVIKLLKKLPKMKEKSKKVKLWDCNSKVNPIVGYRIRPIPEDRIGIKEQSLSEVTINSNK